MEHVLQGPSHIKEPPPPQELSCFENYESNFGPITTSTCIIASESNDDILDVVVTASQSDENERHNFNKLLFVKGGTAALNNATSNAIVNYHVPAFIDPL